MHSVSYPLLILNEEMNELKSELFRLESVDPLVSAKRITELKYLIHDLEFAIEVLETYKD